jgi:iron-sulfur cluster repair protein YtfE (RIC family)
MPVREERALLADLPEWGGTGPPAADLLDTPLDYILADHQRHRRLCIELARFAEDGVAGRADADRVISGISAALELHHQDEEEDLFPMLRRRCRAGDNIGIILSELAEDHRRARRRLGSVREALSRDPAEDPLQLTKRERTVLSAYAKHEQRHLAIENNIVIPIARRRLVRRDVERLSRAMKERRGFGPRPQDP